MYAFQEKPITEESYNKLSIDYQNEYEFSHKEDHYTVPWECTRVNMYKLKKATSVQVEILTLGRPLTEEEYATLSLAQQSQYEIASKTYIWDGPRLKLTKTYRKDTRISQDVYEQLDKEAKKEYYVFDYIDCSTQREQYRVPIYKKR